MLTSWLKPQHILPEKLADAYTMTKIDRPNARAMLSRFVVPMKQAPGTTAYSKEKGSQDKDQQWGFTQVDGVQGYRACSMTTHE